ncbi:WD40-repeat-containing domain protein [Sparassis latifolia]|uniref:WD40 repeat-like protein n=1 Tax=Sparassis crispa TaxID=139825 RepID=A0A401G760_9APHY|nr:WD40 repeat-like protein [Sparassis crispa]GBE78010.1 WD40 repeat-like protein [Sparassis crispa]
MDQFVPDALPWYQGSKDYVPFTLAKLISSDNPDAPPFYCTAAFPWSHTSLATLWTDEKQISDWKETVQEYIGSIAVGSRGRLYVFPKLAAAKPFCVRLCDESMEVHCVTWALRDVADPLVVFAASSLILVLRVKTRKVIGQLRGHGGPITSIAVHPSHPYLFCTTSRDFTTRIYDLTLTALQKPNNPHWPPGTLPSLAGPAHGLQMSEPEGEGCGRCVVVLVGGRSGGHRGAVFCAAFHRSEPLIATCGMDRAVKIWCIPPIKPEFLAREDKPLFSTEFIHKARVQSIAWLSHDTLISHCAPAPMRTKKPDGVYYENGTVVIWRWLGFDRFFPPGRPLQKVMRGCASDWRGSESFKIISAYFLPLGSTLELHVFQDDDHDPLLLIPLGKTIRIMNITHFTARRTPPFPPDAEVVELAQRMQLNDDGVQEQTEGEDIQSGSNDTTQVVQASPEALRLTALFDSVEGWEVSIDGATRARPDIPEVDTCEVAFGGRVILGVGDKGTMFIWRRASR